jgi:branched-chain amino acid transport system ATP-binding protein
MSSLRLDHVSKSFGGILAATDVSLDVAPGRITGLIGPNGAGKTTIVNLITGVLKLTAGTIHLGDEDLTTAPAHMVARAGVSRTFQNIRLLADATVIENVIVGFHRHEQATLPAQIAGLPSSLRESRELREKAMDLLEQFNMARYASYPAGGLAYGHQRRVEMMRAIATAPKILLLDEPVAGMNDVEADELGVIFRKLADGGVGLLLIEHNVRFVTRMCSQVYVLDSGKMIATGRPEDVMRNPAVVAAYLGTHE